MLFQPKSWNISVYNELVMTQSSEYTVSIIVYHRVPRKQPINIYCINKLI